MSTISMGGGGVTVNKDDQQVYAGPVTIGSNTGVTVDLATFTGNHMLPGTTTVPLPAPGPSLPVDPSPVVGVVSSLPGSAMNTLDGVAGNLAGVPGDVAAALAQFSANPNHYNVTPAGGEYFVGPSGAHLVVDNPIHSVVVDFKTGL